jgi:chromosome condensin MukBEF ATPase and DNA-binding subunit MukB
LGEAGIPAESGQAGLLDELFAQIRQAQENFQIEPDALSQRIPTFLTQLIDTLGKPFSQDNTALSSFDEIRKEFLQSLLETAKNLTTEDESPQELTAEATDQNLGSPVPPSTEENGEVLPDLLNESEEI